MPSVFLAIQKVQAKIQKTGWNPWWCRSIRDSPENKRWPKNNVFYSIISFQVFLEPEFHMGKKREKKPSWLSTTDSCLEVRWHNMKSCVVLQGLYFPLFSWNKKLSHWTDTRYILWSIMEQLKWKLLKVVVQHATAFCATPRAGPYPETLQIWNTWYTKNRLGLCSLLDAFLGNLKDATSFTEE